MAVASYGHIVDGKCVNIIALDPDITNVNDFAAAVGGQLLRVDDFADGSWGIGATFDGSEVHLPPRPPQPEPVDNPTPPPSAGDDERFEALQRQIDDLTTMVLEG